MDVVGDVVAVAVDVNAVVDAGTVVATISDVVITVVVNAYVIVVGGGDAIVGVV